MLHEAESEKLRTAAPLPHGYVGVQSGRRRGGVAPVRDGRSRAQGKAGSRLPDGWLSRPKPRADTHRRRAPALRP